MADNEANPERLAAFSDGVIAIIITIMVLELKAPHGPDMADLLALMALFYAMPHATRSTDWRNRRGTQNCGIRAFPAMERLGKNQPANFATL